MMKRNDCTLEVMKKKGWEPVANEQITSILLEAVREGAQVKRTKFPENEGWVFSREVEDDDSNPYYSRCHTEEFYTEYMEVFFEGKFEKAMKMDTVTRSYKTRSQCYMGD